MLRREYDPGEIANPAGPLHNMLVSVPVMRPKLPSVDLLTPYLKQIDGSRTYSNFGRLVVTLEDRLAEHYNVKPGCVATVANATLGLAVALALQQPPARSLCAMPAWTFVASAEAAILAGLVPYFVDVDIDTFALEPNAMASLLAQAPRIVGAVMPVMPFGLPIDVTGWAKFRSQTAIAAVIDAAAAFDSIVPTGVPAVISLHATKVLGVGEGGFIISTDSSLREAVRMRTNFGFLGTREARTIALNAKMSEYQAAVGHASLDEWEQARAEWRDVAAAYQRRLRTTHDVSFQEGFGEKWISSTCVIRAADARNRIQKALTAAGVETRRWWGSGAHAHRATTAFPRANVARTDLLARSTLGIPFYRDISADELDIVTQTINYAANVAPESVCLGKPQRVVGSD